MNEDKMVNLEVHVIQTVKIEDDLQEKHVKTNLKIQYGLHNFVKQILITIPKNPYVHT
jgi:hypothetical protein